MDQIRRSTSRRFAARTCQRVDARIQVAQTGTSAQPAASLTTGMLTYAVGDIHGCFDLLRAAAAAISRHARGRPLQLVLLGDYVDRGPRSRETLEWLMKPRNEGRVVSLMGNHEEVLLRVAQGANSRWSRLWSDIGGAQTLRSYDLDEDAPKSIAAMPREHLNWLICRPRIYQTMKHIFVHAGIDPLRPLTEQGAREFLWIREKFLATDAERFVERRHIVHGHTPKWAGKPRMEAPELLAHRTNLDTGAYASGTLAVGVFDSREGGGPKDVLLIV